MRAPHIADDTLTHYLCGAQNGQGWALIDNLDADEARDVAKLAITMLSEANVIIGLSALALDTMAPRPERFAAQDAARAAQDTYLDTLGVRFSGVRPSPDPLDAAMEESSLANVRASEALWPDGEGDDMSNTPDMMCPHCGTLVHVERDSRLVPTHSWPLPTRQVCPGSKQNPRYSLSDRRPLWNGKPNPHAVT